MAPDYSSRNNLCPTGREAAFDAENNKLKRAGKWDELARRLGVDPSIVGTGNRDPGSSRPPDPATEFPLRQATLLGYLRAGFGALPRASLADWARRVDALNIRNPETGIIEIRMIANEYSLARSEIEGGQGRPPLSQLTRRVGLDWPDEEIGDEIRLLDSLFLAALQRKAAQGGLNFGA